LIQLDTKTHASALPDLSASFLEADRAQRSSSRTKEQRELSVEMRQSKLLEESSTQSQLQVDVRGSKSTNTTISDASSASTINIKVDNSSFVNNRNWEEVKKVIILAVVFGLFYPAFFFACMMLPTWWDYFTRYYIQTYQVLCTHWQII
jgi:hypothetical protein